MNLFLKFPLLARSPCSYINGVFESVFEGEKRKKPRHAFLRDRVLKGLGGRVGGWVDGRVCE